MTAYASPLDAATHGEHPLHVLDRPGEFPGRLGDHSHPIEPGRYHVYGAPHCPRSHRMAIVRTLGGLEDTVSMSYVDRFRDGRGWAFRPDSGPDPINNFRLLREAYSASNPAYVGSVTIPVLWDRAVASIVANNPDIIDVDLATAFGDVNLIPDIGAVARSGRAVAGLSRTIARALNDDEARTHLRRQLAELDRRLHHRDHLLGSQLSLADVRFWTVLVRYDLGPNAHGLVGPALPTFEALWSWARRLYRMPAFRDTTDFDAFRAPLATGPDWS